MKQSLFIVAALACFTQATTAATITYDGTAADGMWTSGPNNPGAPAGANWTIDAGTPGQVPAPDAGTPGTNAIDYRYSGHDWTINGFTVSEDVQIRLSAGSLMIENSTVSLLPSSANTAATLSALNLGQNGATTGPAAATTAVFTNSTVNLSRSNGSGRALGLANASNLSLVGSDVNLTAEGGTGLVDLNNGSTLSIDANSSLTATGQMDLFGGGNSLTVDGGAVDVSYLRANSGDEVTINLMIDFMGGTFTLNDVNPLRDNSPFEGQFNWTGGVGSGSVIHTNPSSAGSALARKVDQGFFSINGTRIDPTTNSSVDGVAALNTELATLQVDGTFFQVLEGVGTQTLVLIPEPNAAVLLVVSCVVALGRKPLTARRCS